MPAIPPCPDASLAAWQRWIAALRQGPLASLASACGGEPLEPVYVGARRAIAGRLLIAFARERLVPAQRHADALELELARGRVRLPLAARLPFELDRPALDEPDLDPCLDDPLALLDDPQLGLDLAARERVRAELLSSIDNLATARLARRIRDRLARAMPTSDDPRLVEPEHFVTEGHPWHPMTRTRLGLGRADSLRHAPELLARCELAFVELELARARVRGDWLARAELFGVHTRPGWVIVPVHPVQRRRLPNLLAPLWGRSLRPIAAPPIAARPLLSMRTVELAGLGHHLKLALGVHTTSARRTVSPMSVADGPTISGLLEHLRARDALVRRLSIMSEPAAIGLEPRGKLEPLARELGAILRVVPRERGEAWVCAALGERWPGRDATLLELACTKLPGGRAERVAAALEVWLRGLVAPALRLFVAYGIALEVHLQNTLLLVEDGRPLGFRVRDLGGIRLHRERLRLAGHAPSFDAASFVITDDLDEVRGKLVHALVHAQLAHVFELAAAQGVPLERSYARLATTIDECLRAWSEDPDEPEHVREAAALERTRLFEPRVRAKALLRMRLSERVSDYEYTWVDNPLARGLHMR